MEANGREFAATGVDSRFETASFKLTQNLWASREAACAGVRRNRLSMARVF
jgi:hypothetical protein